MKRNIVLQFYSAKRRRLSVKWLLTPVRGARRLVAKISVIKKYVSKKCVSKLAVTYQYRNKGPRAFYLRENNVIVGSNPHFLQYAVVGFQQ
jgi:hypothetical protein